MKCLVHRWRIVLVLVLLLSAALGVAGSGADAPAKVAGGSAEVVGGPAEVVGGPEPFPFSDRYPAEVSLASAGDLALLAGLGIDVANVEALDGSYPRAGAPFEPLAATVYINEAEECLLEAEGLAVRVVPNESLRAWRAYGPGTDGPEAWPTFEQFVTRMQGIAAAYPDLVRMVSIGQSVLGRELWMLKISDNVDLEEDEPEFKYSSTMHGIEGVGTELTIRLAELLTANYGVDPDLTELVDEMEIWLLPIHNPDGYVAGTYYNANGVNLNRDYPDRITDPYDDPTGREPETQAMMYFAYDHRFVMGANYHTGALVVNVPWDSVPAVPDYAPDDALFMEYGVGYAVRNPDIWNGPFEDGITRGWDWYIIRGGMQDWAYHWQGEHHVTIEVSNAQPPPYNQMDSYWNANRDAMLWWMGRALEGVRGLVYDVTTGDPLDATVDVVQIGKSVRTDPDVGDYHRLLLPGTYTVTCTADGFLDQAWAVDVVSGTATVQDCAMWPDADYAVLAGDSEMAVAPGETVTHTFTVTNAGAVTDTYALSLTLGAWPAVLVDDQVGPLGPWESGAVRVQVDVPYQPAGDWLLASDVLTLSVASLAEPAVTVDATGTIHAYAYLDVALGAGDAEGWARGGQAITYTLVVTNAGAYTDTYTLALDGYAWPATVMPTQTQPLGPGHSAPLGVRVEVPADGAVQEDAVWVRATSSRDVGLYAEQALTTRRLWGVYLPLIER